jgi:O-antigen/teichoic acid export membrane protein
LSVFWTLSAFSLTGLSTAATQAIARGDEGVYKRSFKLTVLGSLPISLISVPASAYYFIQHNQTLGFGLLLIALVGPFMQASFLFGIYLEAKREFRLYSLFGIILNLFPALLLLGTMFVSQDPLVFFGIYLLGNVIIGLLFGLWVYKRFKPNTKEAPDFFRNGSHFSAMNVLATISQQIDKLLVFHFLGAAQLAVYTFALAFPEQIKGLLNNIATLAFPKFSQRTPQEIEANLWHRLAYYTGFLALATIFYVALAPLFFQLFLPAYTDAIWYSQLFALSLMFVSNTIPLTVLQAQAAKRELYIFNIASPIVLIGTLVACTIFYGLLGVIVARIIGRVFSYQETVRALP